MNWKKPASVVLREDALHIMWGGGTLYPLDDAIDKGRALDALTRVKTAEDARSFTADWGGLFRYLETGGERALLEPFYLERSRLVALTRIASGSHGGLNARGLLEAIDDFWRAEEQLHEVRWRLPAQESTDPTTAAVLRMLQDDARSRSGWKDGKPPLQRPYDEPTWPKSPVAYAMHLLAYKLTMSTALRPVQETPRQWVLRERPRLLTLATAILWSIREEWEVLRYRRCASPTCGREFIPQRADQRYCSDKCSGRERVSRYRRRPEEQSTPGSRKVKPKARKAARRAKPSKRKR